MSCVHGGGGGLGGAGGGSGDGGGSGGDGGRGQPSSASHSMQSCSPHVMSVHHGEQRFICRVPSSNRPQPCCLPQREHVSSLHVHFEHQSSHDAWPSGSRMDATPSIGWAQHSRLGVARSRAPRTYLSDRPSLARDDRGQSAAAGGDCCSCGVVVVRGKQWRIFTRAPHFRKPHFRRESTDGVTAARI